MNDELKGLYGYALYTEDGLSSIGGVCNTITDVPVSTDDPMYNYYKYGAIEWQHFESYGLFDQVNVVLNEIMNCDDEQWSDKRQQVLHTCLKELVSLDSSGLFGPQESGRFIVICLSDSSDPVMERSARELNTQEVYKHYAEQFAC